MKEYVIERTNEMKREWWTGSDWSENDREARWYNREPDAARETQDESARRPPRPGGRRRLTGKDEGGRMKDESIL